MRPETVGIVALGVGFVLGIGVAASCNVSYAPAAGWSVRWGGSGQRSEPR